jgi:magnesium transporter
VPIVDNAIYHAGVRSTTPVDLEQTFETLRDSGGFGWIGMYRPDAAELQTIADEFGLHPLAVEDALLGHQRPKIERYGDTLFIVLRSARYLDVPEEVEFGEVHLFIGANFAISVRHAESPDLTRVRRRLEVEPELLALGPQAVLYAVFDEVVDEFAPVIEGLRNDIDEIEDQLFEGHPAVSRRIYELAGETMSLQRATHPLDGMLHALEGGYEKYGVPLELQRRLRDVRDHVIGIVDRVDSFRSTLENALTVQATVVSQTQNEEMRTLSETAISQGEQVKKISGWAAILFAPSLVGSVYGMNFAAMPELEWGLGYPFALGLMLATSVTLYIVFKVRGWL